MTTRIGRFMVLLALCINSSGHAQQFVTRSGNRLVVNGAPFYFIGGNAYYLMESAALGDSVAVQRVFADASALGITVVRTWAFYDSPDTTNPAVIQYRPGLFNESALRALDYVILQAKRFGLRLLFPLVNSWDEYGGMNQYVRWRTQHPVPGDPGMSSLIAEQVAVVRGEHGRRYQTRLAEGFGHDDFYSDLLIRGWFKHYAETILRRVNVYTGIRNSEEPSILGWELANEPRSSDRTGGLVKNWLNEMSAILKATDSSHLVGSGEEGFDVGSGYHALTHYGNQRWLFDGSAGISYIANTAVPTIDFASIHLYPEFWNLPNSAGTEWIEDHLALANVASKPLIIGEFGVRDLKALTYDSWLTTALLDGVSGAAVWQLLDGTRTDPEGFGINCPGNDPVCATLSARAAQFSDKNRTGRLSPPPVAILYQNYPNPFNRQTIISYALPYDALVRVTLFNIAGEQVRVVKDGVQSAGVRKEILEGGALPSGAYFYRISISGPGQAYGETKKLMLIK